MRIHWVLRENFTRVLGDIRCLEVRASSPGHPKTLHCSPVLTFWPLVADPTHTLPWSGWHTYAPWCGARLSPPIPICNINGNKVIFIYPGQSSKYFFFFPDIQSTKYLPYQHFCLTKSNLAGPQCIFIEEFLEILPDIQTSLEKTFARPTSFLFISVLSQPLTLRTARATNPVSSKFNYLSTLRAHRLYFEIATIDYVLKKGMFSRWEHRRTVKMREVYIDSLIFSRSMWRKLVSLRPYENKGYDGGINASS